MSLFEVKKEIWHFEITSRVLPVPISSLKGVVEPSIILRERIGQQNILFHTFKEKYCL